MSGNDTITILDHHDYWIRDISLHSRGVDFMTLVEQDMEGLSNVRAIYGPDKPLDGVNISGCVSLTYETVAFVRTLKSLGANLRWCADNRDASIDEACAVAAAEGVPVFAKRGMTEEEYSWAMARALDFPHGPTFILDDGGDLGTFLHSEYPGHRYTIRGAVEQTTCGAERYARYERRGVLQFPVINVNGAATKRKFDNTYGSRESLIAGIQHALKMQIAGKYAVVCGYGETGKGCTEALSGLGAHVHVIEVDPICAMQAHLAGHAVIDKATMRFHADLIVTATGCPGTLDMDDFAAFKGNPLIVNMGHSKVDFSTEKLEQDARVEKKRLAPYVTGYRLPQGAEFKVLCDANLANIQAGAGHPPKTMSITFTGMTLAVLDLYNHPENYSENRIYRLPTRRDEECARLNFSKMKLTQLTPEQADYLGVNVDGPFKHEGYAY